MSTNPSETTPAQTPDPFAAFKQQLPGLGQKLLGKRYGQLQKLAGYVVSEQTLNQLTHQLFDRSIAVADQLHQLSRNKTAPQGLLSAAQAEARARKALQLNRLMAAVEGGLTGATGVPGAVVDLPLLLLLSLRTIYQTAEAYGVDLSGDAGRQHIYDVLIQSDLALLGEKQGVLLSIGGVSQFIQGGGIDEFKQTLANEHNGELVQKLLSEASKRLPSLSSQRVNRFGRLASGATGMVYNVRIISTVAHTARQQFAAQRPVALLAQQPSQGEQGTVSASPAEPPRAEAVPDTSAPTSLQHSQPVEIGHGVVAGRDAQEAALIIEQGELEVMVAAELEGEPSDTQVSALLDQVTHLAADVVDQLLHGKTGDQPEADGPTADQAAADDAAGASAPEPQAQTAQSPTAPATAGSPEPEASAPEAADPLLAQFSAQVDADLSAEDGQTTKAAKRPRKRTVRVHQTAEGEFEPDQPAKKS